MLLTLVAVLILILYLSYVFSKLIAKGTLRATQSTHMKVLDRMIVGQDRMILLIQVSHRYLLVGTSASTMSLLAELSAQDVAELLQEKAPEIGGNFKEIFMDQLKSKWKK